MYTHPISVMRMPFPRHKNPILTATVTPPRWLQSIISTRYHGARSWLHDIRMAAASFLVIGQSLKIGQFPFGSREHLAVHIGRLCASVGEVGTDAMESAGRALGACAIV